MCVCLGLCSSYATLKNLAVKPYLDFYLFRFGTQRQVRKQMSQYFILEEKAASTSKTFKKYTDGRSD